MIYIYIYMWWWQHPSAGDGDNEDTLSDHYHCYPIIINNVIIIIIINNDRVTVDKLSELDRSLTRVMSKVQYSTVRNSPPVRTYCRILYCRMCYWDIVIVHLSIHSSIFPSIHPIHLSFHLIHLYHYSDTQKKRRGVLKDFLQDCTPTPITQIGDPSAAPFGRVNIPGPSLLSVKQYVQSLGRGQNVQSSTQTQVYDLSNLFSCNSQIDR